MSAPFNNRCPYHDDGRADQLCEGQETCPRDDDDDLRDGAQRDATESAFTEEERATLLRFADVAESNAAATTEPVKSSWALKARALRLAAEPRVQRDAMPGANAALVAQARALNFRSPRDHAIAVALGLCDALAAAESRAQANAAALDDDDGLLADRVASALRVSYNGGTGEYYDADDREAAAVAVAVIRTALREGEATP